MEYIRLGNTGLMASRTAFGALPIQRVADFDEAASLLRAAYEGGINFFDTARMYTDSEEKLGLAFSEFRKDVLIATKTGARTAEELRKQLETSLANLQTDYIDLYQLHNPSFVPLPGGADGLYDALAAAKAAGKIRHFGITNHSRALAIEAIETGLYETLQFPLSYLSSPEDEELARKCDAAEVGFIAMKALSGGLITNARAAFAWLRRYENAIPIWGIQRREELAEILSLEADPPAWDAELAAFVEADRKTLSGSFCRGCGYCLPCPQGIPINNANRMSQLLRRSPPAQWLTDEWAALMSRIDSCTQCGVCGTRCPYGLKPWETLGAHYEDWKGFFAAQ